MTPGDELPTPFWRSGVSRIHKLSGVRFQAALVEPRNAAVLPEDSLPLLYYFSGLGSNGGLTDVNLAALARRAQKPFVIAAPYRRPGTWWVLDDGREPWGFCDGKLLEVELQSLTQWMRSLARQPGIDPSFLSAFGFSAGAYALTELICVRHGPLPQLSGLATAGLHGHGQPDLDGIDGAKRLKYGADIVTKWDQYINRVHMHDDSPEMMLNVHNLEDALCPWQYTQLIIDALDVRRHQLGRSPVRREFVHVARTRKQKTGHNYEEMAFNEVVDRLVSACSSASRVPRHRPQRAIDSSAFADVEDNEISDQRRFMRLPPRRNRFMRLPHSNNSSMQSSLTQERWRSRSRDANDSRSRGTQSSKHGRGGQTHTSPLNHNVDQRWRRHCHEVTNPRKVAT